MHGLRLTCKGLHVASVHDVDSTHAVVAAIVVAAIAPGTSTCTCTLIVQVAKEVVVAIARPLTAAIFNWLIFILFFLPMGHDDACVPASIGVAAFVLLCASVATASRISE